MTDILSRLAALTGPFAYVLANARPLPFVPCRSMLRFFTPSSSVRNHIVGIAPSTS
jgi:hypothetical protein